MKKRETRKSFARAVRRAVTPDTLHMQERLYLLERIACAGVWGRLGWLFFGRLPADHRGQEQPS